ncbi:TNF receptor-associated factor 3-like [Hydra vulgaris]|uniref:TNF receptor-associated factor 3-like n=1 Tax=Hydra vulgaris TaxID=6087 RepID=UPI0032E9E0EB
MVEKVLNNMENGVNLIKDVENATLTEMDNNCKFIVYNGNQCQSEQCKMDDNKTDFCYQKQDASDNEEINASVKENEECVHSDSDDEILECVQSDSDDEILECVQSDSDDEILHEIFDKYDQITIKKSNFKDELKNLKFRVSQLEDLVKRSDDDNDEMNENLRILLLLKDLDIRVSFLEEPNGLPDGQKIFVIQDIVKRMNINSNNYRSTLFSAPFFYKNYKMSIRINFNMDLEYHNEMIHGDYIGIFVVLMPHIYDAVLKWPFSSKKATISLLGEKKFKKSFITDDGIYYQRPIKDRILGFGFGRFINNTDLLNYIVEDSLFIKCKIH